VKKLTPAQLASATLKARLSTNVPTRDIAALLERDWNERLRK
jgi:hypothetical protein